VVESSALLKRRSPKGYRGFESLPHRFVQLDGESSAQGLVESPQEKQLALTRCINSRACYPLSGPRDGRGLGVCLGLGVGVAVGVAVGLGVAVGGGVGDGSGVGLGAGVGVAVGGGVTVALGVGLGMGGSGTSGCG
jgi:hypothetical protein